MARRARPAGGRANRNGNIVDIDEKRRELRRGKVRLVLLLGLFAIAAGGAITTNVIFPLSHGAAQAFIYKPAMRRAIDQCQGGARKARKVTCVVDGDTGWEVGVKWRLDRIDAPELSAPGCQIEHQKAIEARDRLRELMNSGYELEWMGADGTYGRKLVRIRLANGRYVENVLLAEGLAQPWPNSGNVWCD